MKIGYIRVSTQEQNTIRQEVLMASLGVDEVYIDRMSGKSTNRPELQKMMEYVRRGDMAAQSKKLRAGEISEDDFVNSSEVLCLDVSVSAVASLIGQTVIPIPVLGAVIGNVAGMFMYGIAKDHLSEKEQIITERFLTEMQALDQVLYFEYQRFMELLRKEFAKYKSVLELAFDPQANIAFANSIVLADFVGVPEKKSFEKRLTSIPIF